MRPLVYHGPKNVSGVNTYSPPPAVTTCPRLAVSVWVSIASTVITTNRDPVRSRPASRSRTAGISLLFAATASCPRTVFRAAGSVVEGGDQVGGAGSGGAGAADRFAVDRDHPPPVPYGGAGEHPLPEGPVQGVRVDPEEQPPQTRLLRPGPVADTQVLQRPGRLVGDPLADRRVRAGPGQNGRDPDRQQHSRRVAYPAWVPRVGQP